MLLQENEIFAGRYTLLSPLGRGGFSEVWLATDTKTGIQVALKVYAPGGGVTEAGVQIFAQEFSLVFDLNHTNLLKPSYFDTFENHPYLVLPYCEAGSIAKLIGEVSEQEAWQILLDIASGLEYLHSQEPPVIHLDIKPDNVLISSSGRYLLTDFGISIKVRNTLRKSVMNAATSTGTLAYMGPERFGKSRRPIMASDIFSLGVTMFELITGMVPFGEDGGLLLQKGAQIPSMEDDCSPELAMIIERCLQEEPWERPTASDIKLYAEKYLRGERSALEDRNVAPTPPPPSPPPPPDPSPPVDPDKNKRNKEYPPVGSRSPRPSVPPEPPLLEKAMQWLQMEFRKLKERIRLLPRMQMGMLIGIPIFLIVLLVAVLSIRSANAKRQQREAELKAKLELKTQYDEYKNLVDNADRLVSQGNRMVMVGDSTYISLILERMEHDLCYIDAQKAYKKAMEYKNQYARFDSAGYKLFNIGEKTDQLDTIIKHRIATLIESATILEHIGDLHLAAIRYARTKRFRPNSIQLDSFLNVHPDLPDSTKTAINNIK
jgi:serine/threonine protein kinase